MKLNLGCGFKKLPGFVNVDIQTECEPDMILDLEKVPWPFDTGSIEEVNMEHILEHVGAEVEVHRKIIQELYRICRHNARVRIVFPYPRSDTYLIDPTHVRSFMVGTFEMYSKQKCKEYIVSKSHTTPLALYWNVDFKIEGGEKRLYPHWEQELEKGKISSSDIDFATMTYNNVVSEVELFLRVIKEDDVKPQGTSVNP